MKRPRPTRKSIVNRLFDSGGKLVLSGCALYLGGSVLDGRLVYWAPAIIIGSAVITLGGLILWFCKRDNLFRLIDLMAKDIMRREISARDVGDYSLLILIFSIMIVMIDDHIGNAVNAQSPRFQYALGAALHDDAIRQEIGELKHIAYDIGIDDAKEEGTYDGQPDVNEVTFGLIGTEGKVWVMVLVVDTKPYTTERVSFWR